MMKKLLAIVLGLAVSMSGVVQEAEAVPCGFTYHQFLTVPGRFTVYNVSYCGVDVGTITIYETSG